MANPELKNKVFSYFILMGVNTSQGDVTYQNIYEGKIGPTFLDVYPSFPGDKPPEYLEKFETLAFYDGFKIYDENLKTLYMDQAYSDLSPTSKQQQDKTEAPKTFMDIKEQIYSYVMTDGESNRRYCSTFLFYEKYYLKSDQTYSKKEKSSTLMPKTSLQDLVKYPYTMNDFDLIYIPKSLSLISPTPCFDTQRQILQYMYKTLFAKKQGSREIKIPKKWVELLESLIIKQKGDGDVDELWLEWFSSQGHYSMKVNHEEDLVIKESQLKEFYISTIFSLMDLGKYPFEKVILKVNKEDKDEEFARFRNIGLRETDLPPFDFRFLFQKLSVQNIVEIFKCMLLERQVIFFSNSPGDIPYVTEALLSLLRPLKWCCMYVPFFPISFWEHLHALLPYVVGICSQHKQFIASRIDLSDKVVIDLDKNLVVAENVPELPKNALDYITAKLKELFDQIQLHTSTPHSHEGIWAEVTLKLRHAFNIFMLMLINNYLPFFSLPEDFDPENRYTAPEVFNSDSYFSFVPKEDLQYISDMHNTMMFTNFLAETFDLIHIDKSLHAHTNTTNPEEVEMFIELAKQVEALQSEIPQEARSQQDSEQPNPFFNILHPNVVSKLDTANSNQAKEAMTRYYNPIKIDLIPYLVKYYYQFFYTNKSNTQMSTASQSSSRRAAYHARHTSLASLVTINSEDTKTLNMSCQNFTNLNQAKIVNLNRMFSKSAMITTRRLQHKSLDMNGFANTLGKPYSQVDSQSQLSDRSDGFSKGDPSEYITKSLMNDGSDAGTSSRKNSTIMHESKPEIVKRVIQKLESDDIVFKPNSKRKSTMNSKISRSLQPQPALINEADEFALEEVERRGIMSDVNMYMRQNKGENERYNKEEAS